MDKKILSLLLVISLIFCFGFTSFAAGTAADDNDLSADAFDPATGVELDKESITIKVGESDTLVATVLPSTAANKKVTWTSSDDTIVTVVDGVVTGVKAGTATITVTSVSGKFTDTCAVTVESTVLYGDVDGSKSINMLDVLALRKYLANLDTNINLENANCDKTGGINMLDLLALRRYLSNNTLYPLN